MKWLAAILALWPGAAAACRLALVLALDVSGSVDDREYALQLGGVATALEDAEVQGALLGVPGEPVALAIFEWSGSAFQRQILEWSMLETPEDIAAAVSVLRGTGRVAGPEATGLGAAMLHAEALFRAGPVCTRRTLDVSGDGRNNDWPDPRDVRGTIAASGITVNALVIGDQPLRPDSQRKGDAERLEEYFREVVIQGAGAFVEVAEGFDDYARAMKEKLLREVAGPPVAAVR